MNIVDERYKNGKIYKIVCNETGEIYYGSTIQKYLCIRMSHHKCKKTCRSRQIINRNNYYCELIENYSCNNRKELETRERWYIENNNCINKVIPTRTKKEKKNYNKEYYEENKEKKKEYRQDNKEKIKEYQKEHNKKYYQENKEKIIEKKNKYYQENKDKINEKRKETITCDICGSIVGMSSLKRHQQRQICLSKIEKLNTKTI